MHYIKGVNGEYLQVTITHPDACKWSFHNEHNRLNKAKGDTKG